MEDGKIPQNATEFLEAAAKIFFEAYSTGVWKDGEINQAQNKARNVVGKILAIPGAEHYHGYQKTQGDWGILRDETGDDIDVAFSVGDITFMVGSSEDTVILVKAQKDQWGEQRQFAVGQVSGLLSTLFTDAATQVLNLTSDTLELTASMEIDTAGDGSEYDASAKNLSDEIDRDLIAAQMEGEDIFMFDETGSKDAFVSIPLGQLTEIRSMVNEAIGKYDGALEWNVRTDREHATLNIAGYSIARGNENDPTFIVSHPEGSVLEFKTKSLTDYFDRRFNPNERPLNPDHGN